jgi:phosphoglycolate phosphatase-like HAD superfamily hydrolase
MRKWLESILMDKKNHYIFDYDGTLVDTLEGYYDIHKELCSTYNIKPLSLDAYFNLRRSGSGEVSILKENFSLLVKDERIASDFAYLAEMERFQRKYKVKKGVVELLESINNIGAKISLCTFRRSQNLLIRDLKQKNIINFFSDIVSRGMPEFRSETNKVRMLESIIVDYEKTIFIGDTEGDFYSANKAGISSLILSDGLRNHNFLKSIGVVSIKDSCLDLLKEI